MAPPIPVNDVRPEMHVLNLLREYGDLHRYAVIAFLRVANKESTDAELNLVISKLVNSGRLICDKNDKLSIKPAGKPR